MSAATDTYCLITQPLQAIIGGPTNFTLAITNTSASTAYTVTSVSIWPTNQQGAPSASARVTQPRFPPNATTDVAASSTLYCSFAGSFYGSTAPVPSAANESFIVTAQVLFSDGTNIAAPSFPV